MKSLFFSTGSVFCMIAGSCFAQGSHFANTPNNSIAANTNIGQGACASYNNNTYNNTTSNTASATRAENAPARTYQPAPTAPANNAPSYAVATGSSNYINNPPSAGSNYPANNSYSYTHNSNNGNNEVPHKDLKRDADIADRKRFEQLYGTAGCLLYAPFFYYSLLFTNNCNYPDVENGQALFTGISAMNASLRGQIVYGNDTLYGIVTLTNNNVFLQPPAGSKQPYGLRFPYADKSLKSVIVYNGSDQLFLLRVKSDDKKLSRVIHAGKLSVYDDLYAFSYNMIDERHLRIAYGAEIESLGHLLCWI